jgi:hypothetical protein
MKQKRLTETPVCPQERLVIISNTTGLSFALERIGPLAAIIITVFYLLVLYLSALSNTPENLFASIYSDSLIKTACQHLLLLVRFDTLIYRMYYDAPPILVGNHDSMKDKLNTTLLCFLCAQNKQITFNALLLMIFCLCYFSCCNMVAKFYG